MGGMARRLDIALTALTVTLVALVVVVVPFGYLPGVTTAAEQRAADMSVTIIYTDDERNCGAQMGDGVGGGCFHPETPNVIYVGTWLYAEKLDATILHELGHAWLYQHGSPHDECAADAKAIDWGATWTYYDC